MIIADHTYDRLIEAAANCSEKLKVAQAELAEARAQIASYQEAMKVEYDKREALDNELAEAWAQIAAKDAALRKLVRNAYNEGFSEGMREHTSRKGGKPWQDSDARAALSQPAPAQEDKP